MSQKLPKSSDSRTSQRPSVWQFIRFRERFNPGTGHINIPIAPIDEDSQSVLGAVNRLRCERDFLWLYGALFTLLRRVRTTGACLEGCLLNATGEPATAAQIGDWLHTDAARASKVLVKLQSLGLIDQVFMA